MSEKTKIIFLRTLEKNGLSSKNEICVTQISFKLLGLDHSSWVITYFLQVWYEPNRWAQKAW